ncbi:riboflavin biosynthesis protein [Flavobacterium okayamense]|uniref:Riboflavin biosynthesis protein n=1 Tax=Flavobacterium okayamense TaxID=2830782 RepID=A0ABM7S8G2_9FLAO|nr:riboflavin biosynthesis protein [Flavobacterium okayamense]
MGTFDGVHLGHLRLLKKIVGDSKKEELESIVLTFFPHPRMVLQKDTDIKLLNSIDEKAQLLEVIGIDHLIIHPFNQEFSRLSAEDFVREILVEKLNIKKIVIGYDHRFGRNRTATIEDLIEFGKNYGFEVEQISAEEINDVAISSTKIRNSLKKGDVKQANKFLGYNYMISGNVISGKKIGRTIGFPTANIKINEDYKLVPKDGVYIVSSVINNTTVYGMMNIGKNPTFSENENSLEVYFFNLNKDLYGLNLTISFIERIRDEIKFKSIEELKNQIETDKKFSLSFLKIKNE